MEVTARAPARRVQLRGTMRVPGFSGAKLFLLQTGICFSDQRRQRARMQHLGAVVGQLGRLGISDFVQHLRRRAPGADRRS